MIGSCGPLLACLWSRNKRLAALLYLAEYVIDENVDTKAHYENVLRAQGLRRWA